MPTESKKQSLKEIREACGYTPDYVARMTDIPLKSLEAFECGAEKPSEEQLLLLSKLYEAELGSVPEVGSDPSPADPPHGTEERGTPPEAFEIPSKAAKVFQRELENGERILWYGNPYMNRMASNLMVCFFRTALLLAFYFLWSLREIQSGKLQLPAILLHTLLITGFSFGFELFRVLRNQCTRYAVTDRRVLIRYGFFRRSVIEYRHERQDSPRLWKTAGNRGIIFMTEDAYRFTVGENSGYAGTHRANPDVRIAFVDIVEAERVYALLMHAAHAHRLAFRSETDRTE